MGEEDKLEINFSLSKADFNTLKAMISSLESNNEKEVITSSQGYMYRVQKDNNGTYLISIKKM